jgi:membrane protease YdiL (CAAX protease family)
LGVGITVLAILSQYFVPVLWAPARAIYGNLGGDLFVVYGIPVIAFAVLVGSGPLRNWASRMGLASVEGLSWFGGLSMVSLAVLFVLVSIYLVLDPSALPLLERQNPALTQAAGDPWFWIGFSFVIGACEETIFRGWIFGFWQNRNVWWVIPAIWTSALFAALHLYYGVTYGAVAPLIFPGLFLLGLAFAATYHRTGGNLVVVALLHGAFDATAFYTLIDLDVGGALRYLLILGGFVIGIVYYLHRVGRAPRRSDPPAGAADPLPGARIDPSRILSGPP